MHGGNRYSTGYGSSYAGSYKHEHERSGHVNDSPLGGLKESFWTAKQVLRSRVFGKKEDDHLVASDSELDSKLAVFYAIKRTTKELLHVIENYQDFLCELAQCEHELGLFLKHTGKGEKTQAGKMMYAVGRAETFTAQQRLALRVPLVRLYAKLEEFYERAIADCQETVFACERSRNEYRGSLLWMKNVSQQLDPDTYRQMENFRKVQSAVRRKKAKFDKRKLDVLQKVDVLAASRCNLFSQLLANYQVAIISFWERTSTVHNTVSENFKETQQYEFTILKQLREPDIKSNDDQLREKTEQQNIDLLDVSDKEQMAITDTNEDLLFGSSSAQRSDLADLFAEPPAMPDDPLTQLFSRQVQIDDDQIHQPDDQPSTKSLIDNFLADVANVTDQTSFTYQWQQQLQNSGTQQASVQSVQDSPVRTSKVLPSSLLDFSGKSATDSSRQPSQPMTHQMSSWFSMFAELDPLKQTMDQGGGSA